MKYIKPGTIGYVKDENNVIRQARATSYELGYTLFPVKWDVAGAQTTIRSNNTGITRSEFSNIYKSIEAAMDGLTQERVTANAEFDEIEVLQRDFPAIQFKVRKNSEGVDVTLYRINKRNEIEHFNRHASFIVTEDGVSAKVFKESKPCSHHSEYDPYADEFQTWEDADAMRPAVKVVFLDETPKEEPQQDTMCRIIVEIPKSAVGKLMETENIKVIATE